MHGQKREIIVERRQRKRAARQAFLAALANARAMRKLLLVLLLSLSASAEPLKVTALQWTRLQGQDGDKLSGHITLSAPAPAGGTNLILEPAFKLEMPMTVLVPAGETSVDIPVKITDFRIFRRNSAAKTSVTIVLEGKEYDFPGPVVDESPSDSNL